MELTLHDMGIVAIQGNIDTGGGAHRGKVLPAFPAGPGSLSGRLGRRTHQAGAGERVRAEEGAGLASHGPGDGLLAGATVKKMLAAVLGGRCRSLRLGVRYPAFPFRFRTCWKQDT